MTDFLVHLLNKNFNFVVILLCCRKRYFWYVKFLMSLTFVYSQLASRKLERVNKQMH